MSWLLSPSSATKITPKLTRKASTGLDVLSARRRRGREPATSTGQPCRMPVEGLVHLQSQARGPGLITQRVDHPAWDYSPSPLARVATAAFVAPVELGCLASPRHERGCASSWLRHPSAPRGRFGS